MLWSSCLYSIGSSGVMHWAGWVHGGESDTPDLGDACTDLLVIRVVDEGKDHTVFVK